MEQQNHKYLFSCDWGTSRFRLSLLGIDDGKILYTLTSDKGVKFIYNDQKSDLKEQFRIYLKAQIDIVAHKTKLALDEVVVVSSGMVSSSIGMVEVPYVPAPISLKDPDLTYAIIPGDKILPNEWIIFGGIKTDIDIMRGEEMQLIGLASRMKSDRCICILPGTHSKHIFLEDYRIVDFKTYVTGELFEVLSKYSILSKSVRHDKIVDANNNKFKEGVMDAQSFNLLNRLFTIRSKGILEYCSPEDNKAYLSGLLIGYELKDLASNNWIIYLIGHVNLVDLYWKAMGFVGKRNKVEIIASEDLEIAHCNAHLKLLTNLKSNKK